ncbi:MAG: hypothetical protein GC204_10830 [Chloroflexi bacterium]|nr:hypothetical protein [Chloroflexota bacterium]
MVTDPQLRSMVSAELQRGETLLWVGKPTPLRIILQDRKVVTVAIVTLIALIALGVIVLIFPNSHLLSLKLIGMGWSFGLVVLGFLLLGLSYFARPIYEYFMARRTIYAITDRRAIILKGTLRGRKAKSFKQFESIKRRSLLNGKGDLLFASESYRQRRNGVAQVRTRKIGFFGIDHSREVEQLMIETFSGTQSDNSL